MKKFFVFLLAATVALSFAACGRKDTPASSASAAVSGSGSAAASSSGMAASSSGVSQSAGQSASAGKTASQSASLPAISVSVPSGAQTVTGTVEAIGMSAMTIKTDAGQEVSFSHEGVVNMPNLVEGDRVTVTYVGSLDSADVYAVEKA